VLADLTVNAALLVALSTLYGLLGQFRKDRETRFKVLAGVLFGGMAVAAMNLPFRYEAGIIYDGRSIILALAGLFGGATTSAVSVAIAGAWRAYQGGVGVWAGLSTVVACSLVGLAFRRTHRNRPDTISALSLYGLGLASHAAMLASQLLLPWPEAGVVISRIWLPVLLIFPAATFLIGILLRNEERRIHLERELWESRENYRITFNSIGDAVIATGGTGSIVHMNPVAGFLTGLKPHEAIGAPLDEVFRIVNEETRAEVEEPRGSCAARGAGGGFGESHRPSFARRARDTHCRQRGGWPAGLPTFTTTCST